MKEKTSESNVLFLYFDLYQAHLLDCHCIKGRGNAEGFWTHFQIGLISNFVSFSQYNIFVSCNIKMYSSNLDLVSMK